MSEWEEFDSRVESPDDNNKAIIEFLNKLLKNWYWLALGAFIGLALAFLYLRYTTPIYQINAKVLVNDEKKGAGADNALLGDLAGLMGGKSTVENEVEILKTRTLMEQVVQELNANIIYYRKGNIRDIELYESPFKVSLLQTDSLFESSIFQLKSLENNKVEISKEGFQQIISYNQIIHIPEFGSIKIERNIGIPYMVEDYLFEIIGFDSRVANFMGKLTVEVTNKLVTVIDLGFEYPLKKKGEIVLNTLINKYVQSNLRDKNIIADSTIAFIEERLVLVGQELGNVEGDIQSFKQKSQLADMAAQSQILLQNSSQYIKDLAAIETQLSIINSMQGYLTDRDNARIIPSAMLPGDVVFSGLAERYNTLLLERDRRLLSSTLDNPTIVNLDTQLSNLRQDIQGNLSSSKSNLIITRNDLLKKTSQLESAIRTVPAIERTYLDLERQQQIKQELYVFLLQKREETAISKTSNISNSRIIDAPKALEGPITPRRMFVWITGLFGGIIIPLIILYLRDILNIKIQSKEDIKKRTQVPIIGEIGHNDKYEDELVTKESRSSISENFRSLRTNIAFYLNSEDQKVVLLSSSMSGEGKSFVAINLALILAFSGKKVVAMEMDLRKPNLSVKLKPKNIIGFSNYIISDDLTPKDIIQPSGINDNLFLIGSGPIPPNPSELILSERTDQLIEKLKEEFDYIIIDAPPIGLVTDAQLLSKYADLSLYVVRQGYTLKNQLNIIEDLNKDKKLGKMTILINDIEHSVGYGYGGYGYGYGYYDNQSTKKKRKWWPFK